MRSAKYKLYFALHPPPKVATDALRVLDSLQPAEGFTARPMPSARLHVSLNWVGGFHRPPTGIVGKARDVAAGVVARPFEVSFNRVGTWRSGDPPWPLVLWGDEGLLGVDALHRTIHRAMAGAGMAPRRDPPFEPHLTLLRDRAAMPEAFIDPIRWTVREFVLVLTVQGEGRQEILGRFPLTA